MIKLFAVDEWSAVWTESAGQTFYCCNGYSILVTSSRRIDLLDQWFTVGKVLWERDELANP